MKTSIRILALLYVSVTMSAYAQIPNCNFITTPVIPTVCVGNCISLNGPSLNQCPQGSTNTTYFWSPGGNTTSSITVCPTINTTYTLIVCCNSNSAVLCCDTITYPVQVSPKPFVLVQGPTTICVGQTATLYATGCGAYYQWSTGSTNAYIVVSPTSTSTYTVCCTNANGCTNCVSHTLTVYPCGTGIAENNILNLIHIYPNPFSESAVIHTDDAQLIPSELKIYDLLGKEVKSYKIQNAEEKIYRNNLSSGLYYYRLLQKGQIVGIGKLMIE